MTDKQRQFCDEYIIDCNATRAYKTVYTGVKSEGAARAGASKLMARPDVKAYIDEHFEKLRSEKVADAQEVMEYLTAVVRGDSKDEKVVTTADGEAEIIEFCSQANRIRAAELIGKRYGAFNDKVTLDIEPIVIENDLKE